MESFWVMPGCFTPSTPDSNLRLHSRLVYPKGPCTGLIYAAHTRPAPQALSSHCMHAYHAYPHIGSTPAKPEAHRLCRCHKKLVTCKHLASTGCLAIGQGTPEIAAWMMTS